MFAALVCALAASVAAQERPPAEPTLTVYGNAQVYAAPDQATVRLGVVSQAKTAAEAQTQANQIINRFLAAMQRLNVPAQNIQTASLTVTPRYTQPQRGEASRIDSYEARTTISVRLSDFGLIGRVVDAGIEAGANNVEGINFSLRNDTEAKQRALKAAVADARGKAEAMAEALGIRLERIQEVIEGGAQYVPMDYARMEMKGGGAAETQVMPGELSVRANVTIRYVIRK